MSSLSLSMIDGDLMFLGLIPICIKPCGQVMNLILECRRRTDRVLLMGWWWWGWGMGG